MKYIIQRTTDKQYLVDAEKDTWVKDEKQATKMSTKAEVLAETILCKKYKPYQIDVIDVDNKK